MLATLGIIQSISRGLTYTPPLDTYTGATAAYSFRKLRTAYIGSSVRVRRSSDNSEQDIGFNSNGNLDESSLMSFAGASSYVYITKFYDQSGNGNDATQTNANSQPFLINNGILQKNNNKICYYNNGNSHWLVTSITSMNLNNNENLSTFSLINPANVTAERCILTKFDRTGASNTEDGWLIRFYQSKINIVYAKDGSYMNFTSSNSISINTSYLLSTFSYGGSLASTTANFYNSNSITNTTSGSLNALDTTSYPIYIGAYKYSNIIYGGFLGYIQEMILYPSDQSSNRTGIESNINSYYSIY